MPADSLLISIAVCAVFLAFAGVLAWVDHRTTSWQRSAASAKSTASATEASRKKAA
jgi:hypothetical protein